MDRLCMKLTTVQFIRGIGAVFKAITAIQNINTTVVLTLEFRGQTCFRVV